ncbi:UNVERIFIED_CONTAM: hypothetical protein FKN15_013229 [Acipenser sinensis]
MYRKGSLNQAPDALSRGPVSGDSTVSVYVDPKASASMDLPSSLDEIAAAQSADPTIAEIRVRMETMPASDTRRIAFVVQQDLIYRRVPIPQEGHKFQLVVPVSLQPSFLLYFHDNPLGGHLGRYKTLRRMLEVAWWPSIRKDTWKHLKECEICQKFKPGNQKPAGFLQSTTVSEVGEMLGVDLMGPFPRSKKGNTFLLVIVDYYSKWVELFPLRDSKTSKIVQVLTKEIFTRWGTPRYLLSDRGPQFTSKLIVDVCKTWGVVRKLTTSYHPQTNLTERVNRTLKTMMASYVENDHQRWDQWIPELRFAINTARQETTGFTPAELAVGHTLKGPLDRLIAVAPNPNTSQYALLERQQNIAKEVSQRVQLAQVRQRKNYNAQRRHMQYAEGDQVWVRMHPLSDASAKFSAKLAAKWSGPAIVVKKMGPVNYKIQWSDPLNKIDTLNVVNLKPYFGRSIQCTSSVGEGGEYVAPATQI